MRPPDELVIVLPALKTPWAMECIGTLHPEFRRNSLLVVDNTADGLPPLPGVAEVARFGCNKGVAGSWNVGVDRLAESGRHQLVILSEAVRFTDGGLDFLDAAEGEDVFSSLHGWHLIGLSAATFAACGRFDENFHPAYYEDTDMIRRLHLAGFRERFRWHDDPARTVLDCGSGRSITEGLAVVDFTELRRYYVAKWGALPPDETLPAPWGHGELAWWPTPERSLT